MALDIFIDFNAGGAPTGGAVVGPPAPVQGESQDATYQKMVGVSDFSFGVQNSTTIGSASGGAGAGKAQFQALKITKNVDTATPGLFTACATGSHFKSVKLYVRTGGRGGAAPLVYDFNAVYITQIQYTNGDNGVQEEVQAVYGALQISNSPQQANGQVGPARVATWNQVTNKADLTIPGT